MQESTSSINTMPLRDHPTRTTPPPTNEVDCCSAHLGSEQQVGVAFFDEESGMLMPVLILPRRMDADVVMLLLLAIQTKQGQEQISNAEERIEASQQEREKRWEDILEKLEEIREKQKEAEESGTITQVFSWIGVGLSWALCGVVLVASGGLAAGPMLVAAIAITAMVAAQEAGGMEKAVEAMNLNEKEALGFTIGLAVALIVLQIAMIILSCGLASGAAASSAASTAGTAAQAGSNASGAAAGGAAAGSTSAAAGAGATAAGSTSTAVGGASTAASGASTAASGASTAASGASTAAGGASTAAGTASTTSSAGAKIIVIATKLRGVVMIAMGLSQVGGQSANIDAAERRHSAEQTKAEVQEDNADITKFQEMIHEELNRIRKLIEQMQEATLLVVGVIADTRETALLIRQVV